MGFTDCTADFKDVLQSNVLSPRQNDASSTTNQVLCSSSVTKTVIACGFTDRTADFRDVLRAKQSAVPQAKRRKASSVQDGPNSNVFGKQYLEEAYTIVCRNDVPYVGVLFLTPRTA
jgi:hypothetical protein